MDKETLLGLFGLLGGIFATVKMLLSAYFKKSEELEEVRRVNNAKALDSLELDLNNHSNLIKHNGAEIKTLNEKMNNLSKRLIDSSEESTRLIQSVTEYKALTDSKLKHMESEFHKLSEVLAIIKVRKPQ